MNCNQNCQQGRSCDCGTPYRFDMRDMGTAFGLGVMLSLACMALFFPHFFD